MILTPMRVIENTAERLVLHHNSWIVSAICYFVMLGTGIKLAQILPEMVMPDGIMMPFAFVVCPAIIWCFGLWYEVVFDRDTGHVTLVSRIAPFVDLLSQRQTVPIDSIQCAKMEGHHDETMVYRVAFQLDHSRAMPLLPYFTQKKDDWKRVEPTINGWLGPAALGHARVSA